MTAPIQGGGLRGQAWIQQQAIGEAANDTERKPMAQFGLSFQIQVDGGGAEPAVQSLSSEAVGR